ncbi:MAG TPA: glycosyltransferase family 39 protein [Patescibacteria group bacterium]|nr:glycosyltransferase family 39 protein [Patescibacteria group bacterium]
MKFFKKVDKYLVSLIAFYFLLRLINLTIIPIFNDESIYLDWGWRALHLNVPFYSLYDGKQPLLMWLFAYMRVFISDPLAAGRFVSVLAGFISLVGIFFIAKDFFNEKIARIAALFYILVPIFSFFDRQALMESAVAATEICSIYLFLKLLKKPSSKRSIALGVIMGIGFFIKSTILLLIAPVAASYAYFFRFKQDSKSLFKDLIIALVISQIILIPLYLQNLFWENLKMNDRYSLSFGELTKLPFSTWLNNLWAFAQISFWQLTPLVFAATAAGIFIIIRKKDKYQNALVVIFLLQILSLILVARNLTPRYVMPMLPLGVIFLSYFLLNIKKWSYPLIAIAIIIPAYLTVMQITNPIEYFNEFSNFTTYSDKGAYVTNFTAGYASKSAIDYINDLNIPAAFVTIRLDAGNPETAVQIYFRDSTRRAPNYLEARIIANVNNYECLASRFPIYFVSRDYQLGGLNKFFVEEKRFYNPEKLTSVGVYHQRTNCSPNKTLDLSTPGALLQPVTN